MINQVYTVYDSKAEVYLQPFMFKTKGEAIRAFTETVNDNKSNISRYPEDFTLFHLGEYDDNSGQYKLLEIKVSIGLALEFKKPNV